MVSRVFPGPGVHESTVIQYQYFREPLLSDEAIADAEAKRQSVARRPSPTRRTSSP